MILCWLCNRPRGGGGWGLCVCTVHPGTGGVLELTEVIPCHVGISRRITHMFCVSTTQADLVCSVHGQKSRKGSLKAGQISSADAQDLDTGHYLCQLTALHGAQISLPEPQDSRSLPIIRSVYRRLDRQTGLKQAVLSPACPFNIEGTGAADHLDRHGAQFCLCELFPIHSGSSGHLIIISLPSSLGIRLNVSVAWQERLVSQTPLTMVVETTGATLCRRPENMRRSSFGSTTNITLQATGYGSSL